MAPPGRTGRARRKLGREAGGGAATLSHAGLTRPPLPGAEVTAGLGQAAVAARRAKGPPGGGEQVRGRARPGGEPGVAVRGRRAEGTRAPRNAPGGQACAAPAPPRPLPRPGAPEGQQGAGSSSEFSGPGQSGPGRCRGVGGRVAGSPRDADVGFLNGVRQAQGSFHFTTLPLRQ